MKTTVTDAQIVAKYKSISNSAKQRGLEFNMSLKEIKRLLNIKRCQYTHVKFDANSLETTRSFERLDNNKGYVDGNVTVVTDRINKLRGELTFNEISKIYKYLKRKKLIK